MYIKDLFIAETSIQKQHVDGKAFARALLPF